MFKFILIFLSIIINNKVIKVNINYLIELIGEDMNEIIWGDVDKENDLVESEQL